MAGKKYYAVKKGRVQGVFDTWAECRESVEGYTGAEYQGFAQRREAELYLGTEKLPEAGSDELPESGTLLAYVDGSYDHGLKKYAFGCVFILPDGRIYTEYGNGDNEQSLRHRNVTGEMLGAMYAVKCAIMNGFPRIEIRYDYEGIEKWVTGAWRARTELTRKYAKAMRDWGKDVAISFTKVAAHSNVYYNELADKTAKAGLREGNGIPKIRMLEEMSMPGIRTS